MIVQTKTSAEAVLKVMKNHPNAIWACDTEVTNIDVKTQGPVGNGKVTCVSLYGGPKVDFGDGKSYAIWIENIGEAEGLLQYFKEWFESPKYKKVWHNYGFDRHVMMNEGIDCKGFAGDTMHMARLWDTSRDKINAGEGYSLEGLSSELLKDEKFKKVSMKDLFGVAKLKKDGTPGLIKELPAMHELQLNPATRQTWIEYSARDVFATHGIYEVIRGHLQNTSWFILGTSVGTMFDFYMNYLKDFGELLTDMEHNGIKVDTDGHLKQAEINARKAREEYVAIFKSWVTKRKLTSHPDYINPASSAQIQQLLFGHYEAKSLISSVREFDYVKSGDQIATEEGEVLEKNPYAKLKIPELKALLKEKGLKVAGTKTELIARLLCAGDETIKLEPVSLEETLKALTVAKLKEKCLAANLPVSGKKADLIKALLAHEAENELPKLQEECHRLGLVTDGDISVLRTRLNKNVVEISDDVANFRRELSQKYEEDRMIEHFNNSMVTTPKRTEAFTVKSLNLKPSDRDWTPKGVPQVSASILKKLAGQNLFDDEKDIVWGDAFKMLGGGEEAKEACLAIGALAAIGQVDSTITNFLVPLQALVDKNKRIHCSLNLNTETGRLSSRRPNLQNQPALEKDQYKIRDAFVAEEGNTLIVADYGQLELRILAHITKCKSMIEAFELGGCFHSRTAVGMYPHIKEAVESGKVLLEWDYSKGQPNVPLVKDTYGSERRKAKTLNFSIAYGKTVIGLAQDWGITKEEAQETLDAWYADRPEVMKWQRNTKASARKEKLVRTIMGRYRNLPEADAEGPIGGHALRAAINTPIQGSAADIVMMAMIRLWKSQVLKDLGWKLLLQIHDEVILEGPKESKDAALAEVIACMENPFDGKALKPLLVRLDVDAKSADSWYKAK